jgi:hypothetical protein
MGQYDSPIDGFLSQHKKEPKNVIGEVMIEVGGKLQPLVGITNAVRKLLSSDGNGESVLELAEAVKLELVYCWQRLKVHDDQLEEFRAKLASPAFEDAALAAVDEARWTASSEKIKRIAIALVRSFLPVKDQYAPSDVASLLREVARLGEDDIFILRLLVESNESVIKSYPNLHDPNAFTEQAQAVLKRVDEYKIHRDDFYAHCSRLAGFGFAIETVRNTSRMSPEDYCFRPTRRGVRVLEMVSSERKSKPDSV